MSWKYESFSLYVGVKLIYGDSILLKLLWKYYQIFSLWNAVFCWRAI